MLRCSKCRINISLRRNSFFGNKKLKVNDILLLGYLWLSKASWTTSLRMTGLCGKTISRYYSAFRRQILSNLDEIENQIGDEGIEVEIDESKFGKQKYHRGHRVEGVWILGGVKRTLERKCFLVIVPDRSANTLALIIENYLKKGSITYIDCWRAYNQLENHEFIHKTVNHRNNWVDPDTLAHTSSIEGTWNALKMNINPRNRTNNITPHFIEFI